MNVSSAALAALALGLLPGLAPTPVHAQTPESHETLAGADPSVKVDGSLRLRGESLSSYDLAEGSQAFLLTQARLGVTWTVVDQLKVGVVLQDARVLGEDAEGVPGINDQATPNIYADPLAIHEAWVEASARGKMPVKVKVGRQKFNLGAKRLVASLEWVNTARVWDGMRTTVGETDARSVDLIVSRLVAVNPTGPNGMAPSGNRYFDSFFHAAYYTDKVTVPHTQLESYVMVRQNETAGDLTHTWGVRTDTKKGPLRLDSEAAVQGGRFGDEAHIAGMFHAGAGFAPDVLHKPVLSAAYNLGSGDRNPDGGYHTTFDNLYPLNHAYYGYMDLASLQNMHNAEAVAQISPFGRPTFRVAYQGFWLAQPETDAWYNAGMKAIRPAGGEGARSYVGSEIDITGNIAVAKGRVALAGGVSRFFAGAFPADTGASGDATFGWIQTRFTW